MDEKDKAKVLEMLETAEMILVGIGEELKVIEDDDTQSQLVKKTYDRLAEELQGKNYFIITMNTDDNIYESKLLLDRIVAPCGSIHRYQCSAGCCKELWESKDGNCPFCGADLCENTVKAKHYVEEGYLEQWNRYTKWLTGTLNRRLCILELGVLMDLPALIRWPFEKIAFLNEKAVLVRINEGLPQLSAELKGKAMSIKCHPITFIYESFEE